MDMDIRALATALGITEDDCEEDDRIAFGATYDSTRFTPTGGHVKVRGGGQGNDAFVARLTGSDEKYTFAREFVETDRQLSNSRASGVSYFTYDGDGIYEYRNATVSDRGYSKRGFFLVLDGKIANLGNKRATILKAIKAQESEAAEVAA